MDWDEPTRHELLTAVDEETDRLSRLVANLLDLSRIEGGALQPDRDRYDVREFLETTVARLSRSTSEHRLTLTVAADTGEAVFDYVLIGQVLTNLVDNAVKFAPRGTAIELAAQRQVDAVVISVRDHGPGIPEEERERIFGKFYRVRQSNQRPRSTGLGLAISKGLVEAHGGRITVEEAVGGGACFRFILPLSSAPDRLPDRDGISQRVLLEPPASVEMAR